MDNKWTWHYDKYGCLTLKDNQNDSLFIQSEDEVEAFFRDIGLDLEDIYPGDWDEVPEALAAELDDISLSMEYQAYIKD